MKLFRSLLTSLLVSALFAGCAEAKVSHYSISVVKEYSHDPKAYTQGLFFWNGQMYESTGQYGESSLRKVELTTGKPAAKVDFAAKYFVEGSVVLGDNLYVLTWRNKVVFVYDARTLEYKATWSYPREGWGLTTDGKQLIASDGSSTIYFMGTDFTVTKRMTVRYEGRPVNYLNELEYINGKIWANVYTSDLIMIIDPASGNVEGVVDCSDLLPNSLRTNDTDVLNGIAYDRENDRIYLTGKNWPRIYQVTLIRKNV